MMPALGTFPDGTLGFDCNTPVTRDVLARFKARSFAFVMRYIRRGAPAAHDLSAEEIALIRASGMAVGCVQHFAGDDWHPSAALGAQYGEVAATYAKQIGVIPGAILWCDLEGTHPGTPEEVAIAHVNAWYDRVVGAGFDAGLYVGWRCGIRSIPLYRGLKFRRYWSSYNLNRDEEPAVRGVQMRQWAVSPHTFIPNIPFEWDGNTVRADKLGSTPTFIMPT